MESAHGSFADLPHENPYDGVSRRSFDSAAATVTSYVFQPHARFPLHRHPEEQVTIVLAGEVECAAGGERIRLGPGDWAVFAPNMEHGMTAGPRGARFLAVVVPRRSQPSAYTVVERA